MNILEHAERFLRALSANDLSAFAAVVSALSSVVLTIYTFRLVVLTRALAQETRLTRESGEASDVQCAVEPHQEHGNLLELVLTNVGKGTAKNVALKIDENALPKRGGTRKPIHLNLSVLLPNATYRIYINSVFDMKDEENKLIKANVIYCDKFGLHERAFEQKVEGWLGFTRIGQTPQHKSAKALKNMAQVMSGWNGFKRMQVETFTRADRDLEDREREEWLQEIPKNETGLSNEDEK